MLQVTAETALSLASYFQTCLSESASGGPIFAPLLSSHRSECIRWSHDTSSPVPRSGPVSQTSAGRRYTA